MKNQFNIQFISTLNNYFNNTKSLAKFLMETLELSKESVYRRIRNDVPFTFDEVCLVAQKIGLSIDKLTGGKCSKTVYFELHMPQSTNPADIYLEILQSNIEVLEKINSAQNSTVYSALNRLPFGFVLHSQNLAKFLYFKWLFHTQKGSLNINFQDFEIPKKIYDEYENYLNASESQKGEMNIILDDKVFLYMIKEITYFRKRGVINDETTKNLLEELLQVVDIMEDIVRIGTNKVGGKIRIYLSTIDIEPNYSYAEYDGISLIQFWSPSAELATSYHPEFCAEKKEWISSLIRYTTLITQCNEKQQIEFFTTQRNYIKNFFNLDNIEDEENRIIRNMLA